MGHLPLLLDLSGRKVVVFGGGAVGERKARLFSQYAEVTVASLDFSAGIQQMAAEGSIDVVEIDLPGGAADLLREAFIAIPATSDIDLNLRLEEVARAAGVLVNRVDGVGEVVVPSVVRRGPVVVAVSTLGESPALSRLLRERIETVLDEGYEDMARLLGEMRGVLKERVADQGERRRVLYEIISDDEVWHLLSESYEKGYKRAGEHIPPDERDSLDAGDPPEGLHRRD
ncbi:MAG: Precorrin-2 dehydrogenase [Methanothrix sp.]|jgi:precorrin-2 dehydrogenase/sirohydrochlorin ferrochelatase|nr:MAG: Precorrin-2 dehydrogenase [Methanothrix sp.]